MKEQIYVISMICPDCGTEKFKDANFCYNCGYNFSEDTVEDYRDSYQINVGLSTIIGLLVGILTGIFSAALSQMIHFSEWWEWPIVLIGAAIFMGVLIYSSFNTIKRSVRRQMRRKI
jgi:uncharacterized integral membrane protein